MWTVMKKIYLVAIVLFLFTPHVLSQTIGINSGILMSNLYSTTKGDAPESYLEHKPKIGYSIGISLNYNLRGEDLSIETNLMYANLGSKYTYPDGPITNPLGASIASIPLTLKLNYIVLPVLVRYNLSQKLNFRIGPQFGYLFSDKISSEELNSANLSELSSILEGTIESRFDFGVNTGLGYVLNPEFDISLNFYNEFRTVKKIVCPQCPDEWIINHKNRYLSLSVNYTLSKSKCINTAYAIQCLSGYLAIPRGLNNTQINKTSTISPMVRITSELKTNLSFFSRFWKVTWRNTSSL